MRPMAVNRPAARLWLALSGEHDSSGTGPSVCIIEAKDVDGTVTDSSHGLVEEVIAVTPEIIVGRCEMCFEDMCCYTVARLS